MEALTLRLRPSWCEDSGWEAGFMVEGVWENYISTLSWVTHHCHVRPFEPPSLSPSSYEDRLRHYWNLSHYLAIPDFTLEE